MKKLLIMIFVSVIGIALTAQTFARDQKEIDLIDTAINKWVDQQAPSELIAKIDIVLHRINNIQIRGKYTAHIGALISYIELELTKIRDRRPSSTGSNLSNSTSFSTSLPSSFTIPRTFDKNYLVVAGDRSPLIWKFDFAIRVEPMIIEELSLRASNSAVSEYINQIGLYDETGKLIAVTSPTDQTITFDGFSKTYTPGSHSFYIAVQSASSQNLPNANPFTVSFSLDDIVAEGAYSHTTLSNFSSNQVSPQVVITPLGVATVEFIDRRGSIEADSYLSNGENILGVLSIKTTDSDSSWFHQQLLLKELNVALRDNTDARTATDNLFLQRIDVSGPKLYGSAYPGSSVKFNLDITLGAEQEAVFKIGVNPTLDSDTRESLQLELSDLKNGSLVYRHVESSTDITTVQQSESEIRGPLVTE